MTRTDSLRILAVCVLLFALAVPAGAVDTLRVTSPDPVAEAWRWTEFDQGSGLVGRLRQIYEDREGNIWFGTTRGAQRYDGYSWTTYTTADGLANGDVRAVLQARDGAMWFGTYRGISRFDGKTWTSFGTAEGLPDTVGFGSIAQARDGSIWAGFYSSGDSAGVRAGVARFDGTTWSMVPVPGDSPRPSINGIFAAPDGFLWFGTQFMGVLRFDGHNWTRYTTADGLAGDVAIMALEDRDGAIWAACWDRGISRFDGNGWRAYTAADGLPEGMQFVSVWQTADGTIWASGFPGTVCWFDGERWHAYSQADLPGGLTGYVLGLTARDGSVWMGGHWQPRVFRFEPEGAWRSYTHPDGLFGGIEAADGSVWFRTSRSAVRFRNGVWLAYTPEDGFLDGEVLIFQQISDGSLWYVGLHRGESAVARYRDGRWRIYTGADGLVEVYFDLIDGQRDVRSAASIFETRDGRVWLSGHLDRKAAVCRLDGQRWTRFTGADGLVGEWVLGGYHASDGTLWVWGRNYSARRDHDRGVPLMRYDGKGWRTYAEADGLPSIHISEITEWPGGTLWVGSDAGISRLDLSAEVQTWWSKVDFEVPRPKPGRFVRTKDALWFSFIPNRSAGVVRYDGEVWQVYTEVDGLAGNDVSGIVRASDGAFWFATRTGVGRYDGSYWVQYKEEAGLDSLGPGPVIREMEDGRFWIDSSDGRMTHFRYPEVRQEPETTLEPALDRVSSEGNILLRWSGRSRWDRTSPRDMQYQWRMDGGEWSTPSNLSLFTYTSLSDGRHRFEVRAVDRDGNVDGSPSVHAFVVEPPWWKNPWVLGLAVVFAGITGLGLPITKGFAELLGGSIGVQSEVGKGSVFTVRVPVVYGGTTK